MENTSFYVLCPSNASMDIYQDNKPSRFKINLPKRLYLQGRYEVGLSEIQYPATWDTYQAEENYCVEGIIYGRYRKGYIPRAMYTNILELVRQVNLTIAKIFNITVYRIGAAYKLNETTNRVEYEFSRYGGKDGFKIKLSKALSETLGFKWTGEWLDGVGTATYPPDIRWGLHSFYVYCNFVQDQIVGDTYAPLLRTIPVRGESGQVIEQTFDRPHYVDVNTDEIDVINIQLKNDVGEEIDFASGKVVCKVHFRQKAL